MSEVRKQLAAYVKTDDERNMLTDEELKVRILENLKQTTQRRVKKVKYIITIFDNQNKPLKRQPFEITEPDLLFGTK